MYNFKTPVELDFFDSNKELGKMFNINSEDISISNHSVVEWGMELEMRDWGVKNIGVYVPDQTITISVDYYSDEADEYFSTTKEIQIKDIKTDYELEGGQSISPQTLEFYKGKWTLIFR